MSRRNSTFLIHICTLSCCTTGPITAECHVETVRFWYTYIVFVALMWISFKHEEIIWHHIIWYQSCGFLLNPVILKHTYIWKEIHMIGTKWFGTIWFLLNPIILKHRYIWRVMSQVSCANKMTLWWHDYNMTLVTFRHDRTCRTTRKCATNTIYVYQKRTVSTWHSDMTGPVVQHGSGDIYS